MNRRFAIALVVFLGAWSVSRSASVPVGAAVDQELLPEAVRQQLRESINRAKKETPGAFAVVDGLVGHFPDMKEQSLGRGTNAVFVLDRIGPDALFPLLEVLVYGSPEHADLDADLWPEIQCMLVVAVGRIKDPRAAPILIAVLESDLVDESVLKQTAAALARLETDDGVRFLISILDDPSRPADEKRAVLWGIGNSGRLEAAERLADELRRHPKADVAICLLDSLHYAGIRARSPSAEERTTDEQPETRRVIAEAALWAVSQYDDDTQVRDAAGIAILAACDPETSSLISDAKKDASPRTQVALDYLEELWENSTTRKFCLR